MGRVPVVFTQRGWLEFSAIFLAVTAHAAVCLIDR
jgi:hypothetical protein